MKQQYNSMEYNGEQSPGNHEELFPLAGEKLQFNNINYGTLGEHARADGDVDQPIAGDRLSSDVSQWKANRTASLGIAALCLAAAFGLTGSGLRYDAPTAATTNDQAMDILGSSPGSNKSPRLGEPLLATPMDIVGSSTSPRLEKSLEAALSPCELFAAAERFKEEKLQSNFATLAAAQAGADGYRDQPVVTIEVLDNLILGRGLNGVNLYATQVGVEGLQMQEEQSIATTSSAPKSTSLTDLVPPHSLYQGSSTSFSAFAKKYRAVVAEAAAPLKVVGPDNTLQIQNMLIGSDAGCWEIALTYGGSYHLEQKAVVYSPPYWPLSVGNFTQNFDIYPSATDVYKAQSVTTAAYDAPIFQAVIDSVVAREDDDSSDVYPENAKFKAVARFCDPSASGGSRPKCITGVVFTPQVDFALGGGDYTKVVSYNYLVTEHEIMSGDDYKLARASGQLLGCYHLTLFNESSLEQLYGNTSITSWTNCGPGSKCDTVIVGDGGCASSAIRHLLMGEDGGNDEFLHNFKLYDVQARSVGNLTIVGSKNDTTVDPADGSQKGIGFADVLEKFRHSTNIMDRLDLNCGYEEEVKMVIHKVKNKIKVCFEGKTKYAGPACPLSFDPVLNKPCITADRVIFATTDTFSTSNVKASPPNRNDTVLYRDPVYVKNLSFQVGGEVNFHDKDFAPDDDVPIAENSTVGFKNKPVSVARFWGLVPAVNPLSQSALMDRYGKGEFLGEGSFAPIHVPVMAQMSLYHQFFAKGERRVLSRPNLNADYEAVIKHYVHEQLGATEADWERFLQYMRKKKIRPNGQGLTQTDIIQAWNILSNY